MTYTLPPVWKCERCGQMSAPVFGGVCGSCADDLRDAANMPDDVDDYYNAKAEERWGR